MSEQYISPVEFTQIMLSMKRLSEINLQFQHKVSLLKFVKPMFEAIGKTTNIKRLTLSLRFDSEGYEEKDNEYKIKQFEEMVISNCQHLDELNISTYALVESGN